jgi:hypothetical protein
MLRKLIVKYLFRNASIKAFSLSKSQAFGLLLSLLAALISSSFLMSNSPLEEFRD